MDKTFIADLSFLGSKVNAVTNCSFSSQGFYRVVFSYIGADKIIVEIQ